MAHPGRCAPPMIRDLWFFRSFTLQYVTGPGGLLSDPGTSRAFPQPTFPNPGTPPSAPSLRAPNPQSPAETRSLRSSLVSLPTPSPPRLTLKPTPRVVGMQGGAARAAATDPRREAGGENLLPGGPERARHLPGV
eukprot:1175826-Prorocentrum_minimum.AAC.1